MNHHNNRTTATKRTLSESELLTLGTRAFTGLGLEHKDARDVASILVMADLFGLSTHGLGRIESYGERLQVNGIKARPRIQVEQVAPAMVRVDGDNGVGPLVGMRALEAAMATARQAGVGMAFARGSNHFGPVSPYSLIAAEAGFASIIGSNATTTIAPWGGSDARLGNSPVGFGVPNPGGDPSCWTWPSAWWPARRSATRSSAANRFRRHLGHRQGGPRHDRPGRGARRVPAAHRRAQGLRPRADGGPVRGPALGRGVPHAREVVGRRARRAAEPRALLHPDRHRAPRLRRVAGASA
jgi:hypothetical protein